MKTEFFLKQTHYGDDVILLLSAILAVVYAICVFVTRDVVVLCMLLFHMVFSGVSFFLLRKFGLYIRQGEVYYKTLRERSIDVQEIAGIKIMQEYVHTETGFYPQTDRHGNPLFSITLLRSLDGEMYTHDRDDITFRHKFWRHVIGYAVYDKEAVEYLLYLNPKIEIIL